MHQSPRLLEGPTWSIQKSKATFGYAFFYTYPGNPGLKLSVDSHDTHTLPNSPLKPQPWSIDIILSSLTALNCSSLYWANNSYLQKCALDCKIIANTSRGAEDSALNSLIFISKSLSEEEQLELILDPLTLASWLGIITAYLITVIIFGTIKSIAVNNFDESLYSCVMHQMVKLLYKGDLETALYKSDTRNKFEQHDKKLNNMLSRTDIESGSNKNVTVLQLLVEQENNEQNDTKEADDVHHGRPSKAILHSTIRIVSFLLIVAYEGKLYDAVTFPKSEITGTVQDLVTSGKYSVKMTKDVKSGNYFNKSNNTAALNNSWGHQDNVMHHASKGTTKMAFCSYSHKYINMHDSEGNKNFLKN